MVSQHKVLEPAPVPATTLPEPDRGRLTTTVALSEVFAAGLRLEASAFSIEAREAVAELRGSGLPLVALYGEGGLCHTAHNAFRFKRIYVAPQHGVPFLSSSDIISLRPEIDRYLSRKNTKRLDELLVQKWDVLISRSGTVGNVALAGSTLAGKALSEHVIRLRANDPDDAGFAAAFLRSRHGRLQLTQASYGSVVTHIEPEHLVRILVPDFPRMIRRTMGRQMCEATELRDQANRLLDEADALLHARLGLPPLDRTDASGPLTTTTRASRLMGRLEANFHDPVAQTAEAALGQLPVEAATIGDERVTAEVRAITKFRKRVYVERGGIPLLTSKQLFQIDPIDRKALAKGAHTKDLPEIALKKNVIVVTCSGTVGRVQIIPAYMHCWTASQDAHRIIVAEAMNPGYVYAWLASGYGQELVKRHTYGSVVVHIDREMLAAVPIPLPDRTVCNEIGDLVLRANAQRDEAWEKERAVIADIERRITDPSNSGTYGV